MLFRGSWGEMFLPQRTSVGFFPWAFSVIGLLVYVDFYEYSKLKRLQLDCEINRAIKKPTVIIQQLLIIYKQTSARTVL